MTDCKNCNTGFEITDKDREFYAKMDIPDPELCPKCRMQNRIAFRNFYNLYHRKCDLTGKQIISMYDSDAPFPVYEMNEWWGDKWDPLDYGQDMDFNRPFFEQLKELHMKVPRMNIMNTSCENSEYSNLAFDSKNTYLVFGNVKNEDCCYGHIVWQSKDCFDCLYVYRSEQCYECVDCFDCYNLAFSQSCEGCKDSMFLLDCTSVRDSFGCVGLKNKQYYIFNEPHTKEEYEKKMAEFNSGNKAFIDMAKKKMEELTKGHIVKNLHGINNENVTGDYLYNCKNVYDSYDAKNCEDCRYMATAESFSNSYDCNYSPAKSEWVYNCTASHGYNLRNCHNVLNESADMDYCDNCYASKDCFGAVGIKSGKYIILNKQYSKEEYEALKAKIIEHMKNTGEWGKYFPMDLSPFAYNETMAQEYVPLTQEEAEAKGLRWKNMGNKQNYKGPEKQIPDDIKDADEDIVKELLPCEKTGKLFKIIPQELKFLKEHNLPLPRRSWEVRHHDRMVLRNPRKLWDRSCQKCDKEIKTTYDESRPETVYCEPCYLNEAY